MRLVIQRVSWASVSIGGIVKSEIKTGLLLLLGIEDADNTEDIEWLIKKTINMRIFGDEQPPLVYQSCQTQHGNTPIPTVCGNAANTPKHQSANRRVWGRYESGIAKRWTCNNCNR